VLAGRGSFYFRMFFWIALGVLFATFLYVRQVPGKGRKIWLMFLLAAVYASPFYMTILMGIRPVIRAQLVLPFTMGMMVYLMGALLVLGKAWSTRWNSTVRNSTVPNSTGRNSTVPDSAGANSMVPDSAGAILVRKSGMKRHAETLLLIYLVMVSIITFRKETDTTNKLYYTDEVRYHEDCQLAYSLKENIAGFTGLPNYGGVVVFVGKKNAALNGACLEGDLIGKSFFAWDTEVEPSGYWSSGRIVGFLRCVGINYAAPSREQASKGMEAAKGMPDYPMEGSIMWYDDILVVKLSDTPDH